jgi:hypothetical protein
MCCGLEIQTGNALLSQHSFPAFEASASGRVAYPLSWLSLAAAILGSIVSGLTWFAVSHRESELAKLKLSSQGSGCAFTLQFGIGPYLRRVAGLRARCSIRRTMSVADRIKSVAADGTFGPRRRRASTTPSCSRHRGCEPAGIRSPTSRPMDAACTQAGRSADQHLAGQRGLENAVVERKPGRHPSLGACRAGAQHGHECFEHDFPR